MTAASMDQFLENGVYKPFTQQINVVLAELCADQISGDTPNCVVSGLPSLNSLDVHSVTIAGWLNESARARNNCQLS